ncbi:MAG: hypothetical protein PUH11_03785, partial [Bacilli bacterium]|nr:hypothetical protein [Bacilli bacterium]
YEYNYQGIRTRKIINNEEEINYYLNGNKIIGERKINKTTGNIIEEVRYYYDIGGVCGIEYKKDNETYYYNLIKDTLGNISKVMYRGKVIGEYSYDAWGNVTTIIHEDTNPNEVDRKIVEINPYRYKGYYMDIETGLYYCNARYYDPKIYQWIQPAAVSSLDSSSITGLELHNYENNNSREVIYNNSELENFLCRRNFMNTVHRKNLAEVAATGCKNLSSSIINDYFTLPKINSVTMIHNTIPVIDNSAISWLFGNISFTTTTQLNSAETFYSFNNVGTEETSFGVGINLDNLGGASVYLSTNFGFGSSWQLGSWLTGGSSWDMKNGISLSGGFVLGNTTYEMNISIGNGVLMGYAICAFLAAAPFPGARGLAALAACFIFVINKLK